MELRQGNQPSRYLWVSMDAFTEDAKKIGVPSFNSGAVFQQNVDNMNVATNAKGIDNGTDMSGGNIEFWPNNYSAGNKVNVPGADGGKYDFGDVRAGGGHYGSMQVHNHEKKVTLFALNKWHAGGNSLDLGIGNGKGKNPDYTFSGNGGSYSEKRLRVFVREK